MDRQMAIEEILVNMEEVLENAKSMPFSDKVVVDREELFDLITDIRLKMPNEIEQSKWVLDEKSRILEDAKRDAELKIKEAEEERDKLINESEITRRACTQAEEIVSEAKKVARDMRMGAKEYADDLLMQLEEQMKQLDGFVQSALRGQSDNRKAGQGLFGYAAPEERGGSAEPQGAERQPRLRNGSSRLPGLGGRLFFHFLSGKGIE